MPSTSHDTFKAILHCAYSSRPEAALQYNKDRRKLVRTLDGCDTGVIVGKPKQDAELLRFGHHDPSGKKCEVLRALVLTVETPPDATAAQLQLIDDNLEQAFFDLKKHLGIKQMVGHIHGNTRSRHLHILLPNSDGRRGLDWGPKFLSSLQDFSWTDAFESGRGKGVGKSLGIYPHARKSPVCDLANLLVDEHGTVHQNRWKELVAAGRITNPKHLKDGSLRSFDFDDKRVRFSTLQDLLAYHQNNRKEQPMTVIVTPAQPLPPSLKDDLAALGFTPTDLTALSKTLAKTHQRHRQRQLDTPDINPTTPEI